MILHAHFYLLNDEFSQDYADEHHNGEASEDNQEFQWEDELEIAEGLRGYELLRYAKMPLQGFMPNGDSFIYEVKDMFLVLLQLTNGNEAYLGVSESILDSYVLEKEEGEVRLRVFIKDYEPHANPIPGVYIASKEFPKALSYEE